MICCQCFGDVLNADAVWKADCLPRLGWWRQIPFIFPLPISSFPSPLLFPFLSFPSISPFPFRLSCPLPLLRLEVWGALKLFKRVHAKARPPKAFWCILILNCRIWWSFSCCWCWWHFINFRIGKLLILCGVWSISFSSSRCTNRRECAVGQLID